MCPQPFCESAQFHYACRIGRNSHKLCTAASPGQVVGTVFTLRYEDDICRREADRRERRLSTSVGVSPDKYRVAIRWSADEFLEFFQRLLPKTRRCLRIGARAAKHASVLLQNCRQPFPNGLQRACGGGMIRVYVRNCASKARPNPAAATQQLDWEVHAAHVRARLVPTLDVAKRRDILAATVSARLHLSTPIAYTLS